MQKKLSKSVEDTAKIAREFAKKLKGNETILLHGELGAGKTAFAKALAAALGVEETVTSPTFTFLKTYTGRAPFFHFDLYRAKDETELLELGLKEYIGEGICVIEWNCFKNLGKVIEVKITRLENGDRSFEWQTF